MGLLDEQSRLRDERSANKERVEASIEAVVSGTDHGCARRQGTENGYGEAPLLFCATSSLWWMPCLLHY